MAGQRKESRIVNEEYLNFIRQKPCCISGDVAEPHHLVSRGAGGPDYYAVPLSRKYHTIIETIGRDTFQARYSINLWAIVAKNMMEWILKEKKNG